jgi:nucleoside-diphosphate-sugar epimerase
MKVLITGGNGRAGSYVVKEFLDYGYEVINADLSSPNFVETTDKN